MKRPQYDVIVVGAGPAGAAAACRLAQAGMRVLLLERGEWPGAKNVSGCVFHPQPLAALLPRFWNEAPIERQVARHSLTLLDGQRSVGIDFRSDEPSTPDGRAVLVSRSRFDRWLADQAVQAGTVLVTSSPVDGVLVDAGRVVGVHVNRPDGDVYAPVVVAADGVNSIVVRRAGLAQELQPSEVAIGVKETLALPAGQINERFGLAPGRGMTAYWAGVGPWGVEIAGFLYTLETSLALGVVVRLSALTRHRVSITDAYAWFKSQSAIARLVEGARLLEYAAHLIPEGGFDTLPRLYAPGLLVAGDAARLVVSTGLMLKGVSVAIASGLAAAETILAATGSDFSAAHLRQYLARLRQNGVLQEMQAYRRAPVLLETGRLFSVYPQMSCDFAESVFLNSETPRPPLWRLALRAVLHHTGWRDFLRDAIEIGRSL